jgi:hypothetical protein
VPLVDQKLCGIALDYCDTAAFEQFVQAFHAALVGSSFVPLGGMHDGGADGFQERLLESSVRPGTYLQASKTSDIRAKIKKTIKRLKEFGRDPKVLFFYFSEALPTIDRIEEDFSNKYDITVRIRAKQYIISHINDSPQSAQAFDSILKPFIYPLLFNWCHWNFESISIRSQDFMRIPWSRNKSSPRQCEFA